MYFLNNIDDLINDPLNYDPFKNCNKIVHCAKCNIEMVRDKDKNKVHLCKLCE